MLNAEEFSSVFSNRRAASGEFFQIHVKQNGLEHFRLGLVVGKRVQKLAVLRNYAKRMIREFYRQRQQQLRGVDLVVRLRKPLRKTDSLRARLELEQLLEKVRQCGAC